MAKSEWIIFEVVKYHLNWKYDLQSYLFILFLLLDTWSIEWNKKEKAWKWIGYK